MPKEKLIVDEYLEEKIASICACAKIKETDRGKVIACLRDYRGENGHFYDYDHGCPLPVCKAMIFSKGQHYADPEKMNDCPDRESDDQEKSDE